MGGNLAGTGTTYASSILYAAHGAPASIPYAKLTETTTYNARMQPASLQAGSLLALGFAYCSGGGSICASNNGNLLKETIAVNSQSPQYTQIFTYDAFGRLTQASEGSTWSQSYGYDVYGNRWVSAASGVAQSPFTPTAYSNFDAFNRLTILSGASSATYDAAGNQNRIGGFASVYDVENRLVTSTLSNGVTPISSNGYVYDGDGRRVQKLICPAGTSPCTPASTGVTVVATYVYNAQGQLAAEYGTTAPVPYGTQYLTTDHLGSTRMVTDSKGSIVALHDYLPFGEEIPGGTGVRSAQLYGGTDNPRQKFTGKERATETGLDYFGARYNSSAQGRFTSPDPHTGTLLHVLNPQRWNMYAYAVNNPLSYVDPDGRDAIAVDFGNMAVGMGHWGIISVNRDGGATFSEFGPRGGAKPAYPGQYTSYGLDTKVTVGSNGVPTPETLAAVQKELAQHEGQPQGSISLAYYKTSDAETASLNGYIQAAIQAQVKGDTPFYFVGFNDCRDYSCSSSLNRQQTPRIQRSPRRRKRRWIRRSAMRVSRVAQYSKSSNNDDPKGRSRAGGSVDRGCMLLQSERSAHVSQISAPGQRTV